MAEQASQLEWERRVGRPVAVAAFASVLLSVASVIAQSRAFPRSPGDRAREALRLIDEHSGAFLASSILRGLSYLTIGAVLWYLFRATRHRRPELPAWLMPLIYFGPLVLAVSTVLTSLAQLDAAQEFITRGAHTEARADSLINGLSQVPQFFGLAGSFAFAVSLVLVSMNAMRVGLLTRFLGIIGVVIGALIVLPLVPGVREIIQIFWLGAIGAIILGVWPGGRGRTWETGLPDRWLSAAEQRRAALREGGGSSHEQPVEPEEAAAGESSERREPAEVGDPAERGEPSQHPVSKKRRKKRRR